MKRLLVIGIGFLVFTLIGCSLKDYQDELSEKTATNEELNQSIANDAVKEVTKFDEVTQAVSLVVDDQLLLAFRVKQFEKFHLKSIEAKVKKKLEREFPKVKTTVSSDLKIYLETTRLQKKMYENNLDKKKLKHELSKIEKLSEEQT